MSAKNTKAKPIKPDLNEQDHKYLDDLRASEFHSIDEFDKTVLALTGGAFGVSFAFLKDIVTPDVVIQKKWLVAAWVAWCVALTVTLTAFYFSHLAMRGAQRKYCAGIRDEKELRGYFGTSVMWLNPIAGILFITGLICMSVFVTSNLHDARPKPTTNTAPAITTTNTAPAITTTNAAPR